MRVIWKFAVEMTVGPTTLEVPVGARWLSAGMQDGAFVFWVEVDPGRARMTRAFRILPTGGEVLDGWLWRATVQDEPFVWHLYEKEDA